MSEALDLWLGSGPEKRSIDPLVFLGLLVDDEWASRENRKLTRRLQEAKLPMQAAVEDIDYRHPRGLERQRMLELLSCRWIQAHENAITTGLGRTYLPCALGQKACRDGYRVLSRGSLLSALHDREEPVRAFRVALVHRRRDSRGRDLRSFRP